jgi:hypothetical protein
MYKPQGECALFRMASRAADSIAISCAKGTPRLFNEIWLRLAEICALIIVLIWCGQHLLS